MSYTTCPDALELLRSRSEGRLVSLCCFGITYTSYRDFYSQFSRLPGFTLATALNRLHIAGDAQIKVVGWTWFAVEALLLLLGLLFIAVWHPKESIVLANSRIVSYVGCDGATTDPCIIVQQEWRLLPGVAWKHVLYVRKGRAAKNCPAMCRNLH